MKNVFESITKITHTGNAGNVKAKMYSPKRYINSKRTLSDYNLKKIYPLFSYSACAQY